MDRTFIIKMTVLPELMHTLNTITIQISKGYDMLKKT